MVLTYALDGLDVDKSYVLFGILNNLDMLNSFKILNSLQVLGGLEILDDIFKMLNNGLEIFNNTSGDFM